MIVAELARVIFGQAAGSIGMISMLAPLILSATKGKDSPAKLLPPPAQPITISGSFSPAVCNCFLASRPIIV
jgi:hypothetical protein